VATAAAMDADDTQSVKEGILRSLQKLNDRDTNKTAIDEMHEIIEVRRLHAAVSMQRGNSRWLHDQPSAAE
jgi:hypothetical protein